VRSNINYCNLDYTNFKEIGLYEPSLWSEAASRVTSREAQTVADEDHTQSLFSSRRGAPSEVGEKPKNEIQKIPRAEIVTLQPQTDDEMEQVQAFLAVRYPELRSEAQKLIDEALLLGRLDEPVSRDQLAQLQAIQENRGGTFVPLDRPRSALAVAREIQARAKKNDYLTVVDEVMEDMVKLVQWMRRWEVKPKRRSSSRGVEQVPDAVRDAVARRGEALASALPPSLQQAMAASMRHVDRELLRHVYASTETLEGEPVEDIPRDSFWVSSDNYAWNIHTLVDHLWDMGRLRRNPLTRKLFTPADIRSLVAHPGGQSLAEEPLELSAVGLVQGVRTTTLQQLAQLALALQPDGSFDQEAANEALDIFEQYMVTLPAEEQEALDKLRVPAADEPTKPTFDCPLGEILRDAFETKAGLQKVGRLTEQAVSYLQSRMPGV